MDCPERLSKNLKALKEKYGYGNLSLAKKAGVGEGTVSRACRADVSVTLGSLESIAAVFGMHAWELLAPEFDVEKRIYANHISPEEERRFHQLEQAASALGRVK